mgnify:CR=1 FL=1
MNSNIYNKALDIINKRRYTAKSKNEQHFIEVENKIPEIKEINRHLAQTSYNLFKIIQEGQDISQKVENLQKQNLQAQEMVNQLLLQNGFPQNYLDVIYTCSDCFDTGYVNGSQCKCLKDLIGKLSVEELNSHSQIKLCNFSSFNLNYYKGITTSEDPNCHKTMSNIFQFCQRYAENFSLSSSGIFMLGKTGLGKTHLSLSIAEVLIKNGWNVLYDSTINYLRQIEKEHFGRDLNGNTLQILLDADLIILDDLGSEYDTSFYVATIYNIINTRLNKNLPTIINTNLTPQELERKYDSRIVSRLFTMYTYLKFTGNDVRQIRAIEKNKQNN